MCSGQHADVCHLNAHFTLDRYDELEAIEVSKKLNSLESVKKEDQLSSNIETVDVPSANQSKAESENSSSSTVTANGKQIVG
jgi:hypothetical protein